MRLRPALRADALDIEHERPFEALGRRNAQVLAVEDDVVAVGRAADVAPLATRPDVHLGDLRGRPVRTPPAGDDLRIGEGLPDPLARCIEGALEDEVAALRIDGRGRGATPVDPLRGHCALHFLAPWFFYLTQVGVKSFEAFFPVAAVLADPIGYLPQRARPAVDAVATAPADPAR